MKVSALIDSLTRLMAEHGDLYTDIPVSCCCYGDYELDADPRLSRDGKLIDLNARG